MSTTPAFRVKYTMQRRDYVALSTTMSKKPPIRTLVEIAFYVVVVLMTVLVATGSLEAASSGLRTLLTLRAPWWVYPILGVTPLLMLFHAQIMGLIAALIYKRNAIADREMVLDFTSEGIEGGVTDLYSRIGWNAVRKLIETPTHLFVAISRREALIVPRRALPHEDDYRTLLGFIRARAAANLGA